MYGQLGNRLEAAEAVRELLAVYPGFPDHAKDELEKWFFESAHIEHLLEGLRKGGLSLAADAAAVAEVPLSHETGSGPTPIDEGFAVAVAPFTFRGSEPALQSFADGLTEEINAGLSRFSYLRVVARGTSATAGRFLIEGNVRQAGSRLRVTVKLSETATATQLWAETYEREFSPNGSFELQDDLVARVVATCADQYGVLPRSISDVVRGTDPTCWSPYEALMHFFGYDQRLTPTDHRDARTGLERAVAMAPRNADCWAMLSLVYAHEYDTASTRFPTPWTAPSMRPGEALTWRLAIT